MGERHLDQVTLEGPDDPAPAVSFFPPWLPCAVRACVRSFVYVCARAFVKERTDRQTDRQTESAELAPGAGVWNHDEGGERHLDLADMESYHSALLEHRGPRQDPEQGR